MLSLSHGSDLRLSPTLGPAVRASAGAPRQVLQQMGRLGFQAVQLDATLSGLRPRELDASARRDLAATVARAGLQISGVDFFIPSEHYHQPEHLDRAAQAALSACALAGELGRVPLCINLPIGQADEALVEALITAADAGGVRLAVHHDADVQALGDWLAPFDTQHISAAIDPAALLMARTDPVDALQQLGGALGIARLSDARQGQADAGRLPIGQGDLDLLSYRVSVDLAQARSGPVVLDLRGLANPLAVASASQSAWDNAGA